MFDGKKRDLLSGDSCTARVERPFEYRPLQHFPNQLLGTVFECGKAGKVKCELKVKGT